jgi:NAD(P)-dependent dehydrogenase (short-subunit alcohol dehydrogenase family)
LQDKVVAITGGGRGIGLATAGAFLQRGARVIIGDIDVETAKRGVAELESGAAVLSLDVADTAGFEAFINEVIDRFGRLDVLINNAGIMHISRFLDESPSIIRHQVDVNLLGTINGTRAAATRMRDAGTGHIVNVASIAGKMGTPGLATYSATKFGIVGYSECVRLELAGTGVQVSVIMPRIVSTELSLGMTSPAWVKNTSPARVAAAIVAAVEHPAFDIYVPRIVSVTPRLTALLPRRVVDKLIALSGADHSAIDAVSSEVRADYERRICAPSPVAVADSTEADGAAAPSCGR